MRTFVEFLETKGTEGEGILTERDWIAGAIKHPGRCTPFPNPDCSRDSPQGRLAARFKGEAPKGNIKKKHKKKSK